MMYCIIVCLLGILTQAINQFAVINRKLLLVLLFMCLSTYVYMSTMDLHQRYLLIPSTTIDSNKDATSTHEAKNTMIMSNNELQQSILVAYRSIGMGTFGAIMRYIGMPLEKIALHMNSSKVSGSNQFQQSIQLTFSDGLLSPYRVVGPASVVAWFVQYSIMSLSFQFFDRMLSNGLDVKRVWYGEELMLPPPSLSSSSSSSSSLKSSTANDIKVESEDTTPTATSTSTTTTTTTIFYKVKSITKSILANLLVGTLESAVANRAEVQRYWGLIKTSTIETTLNWNPLSRYLGPAFLPNVLRNSIMCYSAFIITPITYRLYFPQDYKSSQTLFWYGMCINMISNALAITQQALWGRALDYAAINGGRTIKYGEVITSSLAKEGLAAFITLPKWASRILMNAPTEGSLPWFYNNVLPLGEEGVLEMTAWVLGNIVQQ